MAKLHTLLYIKTDSEINDDTIKKKNGDKLRLYTQEVGVIFDIQNPHEYVPMNLPLKEDAEPLPEGFYCLIKNLQVNKYRSGIEIDPFGKTQVVPIGNETPSSYEELVKLAKGGKAHKSVPEKRSNDEESQTISDSKVESKVTNFLSELMKKTGTEKST